MITKGKKVKTVTALKTAALAAALSLALSFAFAGCAPAAKTASARAGNTIADVQAGRPDSGPTALMRAAYRSGDFATVEKQFEALTAADLPESYIYGAYYLMGLTLMRLGEYQEARRLLRLIPDDHPDYAFARHAAADAGAMNALDASNYGFSGRDTADLRDALDDLVRAVQIKPKNNAQKEIVNRSYLLLGVILYEHLYSDNAITVLRKVARDSRHYQDALLVLGWAANRANRWDDCLNAGGELANISRNPVVQSEANLLQAMALLMQKDYDKSFCILECAFNRLGRDAETILFIPEIDIDENEYEFNGNLIGNRLLDDRDGIEVLLDDVTFALARCQRLKSGKR